LTAIAAENPIVVVGISELGASDRAWLKPLVVIVTFGKNKSMQLKIASDSKNKLCLRCIIFKTYNLYIHG
jgi:hypothetical protein